MSTRNELQPDDGGNEGEKKEYAPEICGLLKIDNAY
jgi:hypothetical protein